MSFSSNSVAKAHTNYFSKVSCNVHICTLSFKPAALFVGAPFLQVTAHKQLADEMESDTPVEEMFLLVL